jgi:hypothetical protein
MIGLLGIRGLVYAGLAAVVFSTLAGSWYHLRARYVEQGYEKALHEIALKNEDAIKRARAVEKKVGDCYAAGKTWNVENGTCN